MSNLRNKQELTGWAHQEHVGVRMHSLQFSFEVQGLVSLVARLCAAVQLTNITSPTQAVKSQLNLLRFIPE